MKKSLFIAILAILVSCNKAETTKSGIHVGKVAENKVPPKIHTDKNTVKTRFDAPDGYKWKASPENSFGSFLENFKLKNYGDKIVKFDGNPIATQDLHEGIFDISVGTKDLQQCADAVMRLRAEYLKSQNREDEIGYHYTGGEFLKWTDYKNGKRFIERGNRMIPTQVSPEKSPKDFQNYLENIFSYSNTISLDKDTKPVKTNADLKTGDILNWPGSPGHVVIIVGTCENPQGKKLYLLAEGFMPAQSIHIVKNPFSKAISPWYELDVNAPETKTARFTFKSNNFRSFKAKISRNLPFLSYINGFLRFSF